MLVLFALGAISCYTGVLLKRCLDSSPELQTYPDIGQAAFGMTGRLWISVSFLTIELLRYELMCLELKDWKFSTTITETCVIFLTILLVLCR